MLQQTEIETVYRSDDVIVVNKPPFIPTSPLGDNGDELCLVSLVRRFEPRIMVPVGRLIREGGLIHRLDTPTRGLVLFALTQEAYDDLIAQQKHDRIIKQYRATFTGRTDALPEGFPPYEGFDPANECGVITSYFRSYGPRGASVRPALSAGAKRCSGTLYSTQCEVESPHSVICTISRGFRHQIRCHMAWAGYPLEGDVRYGGTGSDRFGLEAIGLSFRDPANGTNVTVTL